MYDYFYLLTSAFEDKANKCANSKNFWIFKGQHVDGQPLLIELDSIAVNIPDIERIKIRRRFANIIPDNAEVYIREYDDQFLEVCVEILGWGWLKKRYPVYIPEFNYPNSPDLLVKNDNNIIASMECKKIRTSNEDRDYYQNEQGTVKQVKNSLTSLDFEENPLLRKLHDTLHKAEKQVNLSNAPEKYIYLDLSLDTPLHYPVLKNPIFEKISQLDRELRDRGILLISFEQNGNPITGI